MINLHVNNGQTIILISENQIEINGEAKTAAQWDLTDNEIWSFNKQSILRVAEINQIAT